MSSLPRLLLALALAVQSSSAPPARWLLRFADGRVHRGVAREVPGGFEIPRAGTWQRIAADEIRSAVLESRALEDLAARRTAAGAEPSRRVEVARWALDAGLLAESIAEVDVALEIDPDLASARRFVAGAPLSLTLPAGAERSLPERLVLFGSRAKPALRELAAAKLASLGSPETDALLTRSLSSTSSSVRAFAAFASRRIDPHARTRDLVRRSVLDPSDRVRLEAARALRDAADPALARRVAAALELDDARLRIAAARSLADMGYREAVPALAARLAAASSGHPGGTRAHILVENQVAYVQDFNPEIAQGASIADPIINTVDDATVLDVRVGGTSTQTVEIEGPVICRTLARLTGERLPEKPSAWLDWWKRNGSRYAAE
jgi:hypothetical protein